MLTREKAIDKALRIINNYGVCSCEKDDIKPDGRAPCCTNCQAEIAEALKQQPEQPRREIIALSTAAVVSTEHTPQAFVSVAACKDGTNWAIEHRENKWWKLPPIPQDDEK